MDLEKQGILMLPHPLTNLETQRYYQNDPRLNGVYLHDNLLDKIKVGAYVINLDEYADIGTHWIPLYSNGVEHIPKEIKKFIKGSLIKGSTITLLIYFHQIILKIMIK